MENWQVGVRLVMTHNLGHATAEIIRALTNVHVRVGDVQRALDNTKIKVTGLQGAFGQLGSAIQGVLAIGAGGALFRTMDALISKAEELNLQFARLQVTNVSPQHQRELDSKATDITNRRKGVARSDVYGIYGKLRDELGHDKLMPLLDPITQYSKVSRAFDEHAGRAPGDMFKNVRQLVKAGAITGRITNKAGDIDDDKFKAFLEDAYRLKVLSHGGIDEQAHLNYAKHAGIAAKGLSREGYIQEMLLGEQMGFARAGTAKMSEFQQFQIKRMPKAVALLLEQYGIFRPNTINDGGGSQAFVDGSFRPQTTHGRITGIARRVARPGNRGRSSQSVMDGEYTDPALSEAAQRSVVEFIAALEKKMDQMGVPLDKQVQVLGQLSSRSTTFRRLGEVHASKDMLERGRQAAGAVKGMDEAEKIIDTQSIRQARENLSKAWQDLVETFVGPQSTTFIAALNALTEGLRKFNGVLQGMDRQTLDAVTSGLLVLSGILVAGGALRLAIGVGGWLIGGFGGLAGLLGVGGPLAAALGPVGWFVAGLTALVGVLGNLEGIIKKIQNAWDIMRGKPVFPDGKGGVAPGAPDKPGWVDPPRSYGAPLGDPYLFGGSFGGRFGGRRWTGVNDNYTWSDIGQGRMVVSETPVRDLNRNIVDLTEALKRLRDAGNDAAGSGAAGSGGGFGGSSSGGALGAIAGGRSVVRGARGAARGDFGLPAGAASGGAVGDAARQYRQYAASRGGGRGRWWQDTGYKRELVSSARKVARELGMSTEDLLTFISFETAGSIDPWKAGPRTKWGQHRGLIQWGEPQARKYGVHAGMPVAQQMDAVKRYLLDHGYRPGMSGANAYAAVNAGHASKLGARDYAAGGTPGTVLDKWRYQMGGHRANARRLLQEFGDDGGSQSTFMRKPRVPPPSERHAPIKIQNDILLDGRKVTGGVTRHQGEYSNGPSMGGQSFDRSRQFAGNESAFKTAV